MKIQVLLLISIFIGWYIAYYFFFQLPKPMLFSQTLTTSDAQIATFAWWCFWCLQPAFDSLDGVIETTVWYAWGDEKTANYDKVSMGTTTHKEAIQIVYNPDQVSYTTLLETYWRQIDPTDPDGQFADKGKHYKTAIFYHTQDQYTQALASKDFLEQSDRYDAPIVTEIVPYTTFFPAEAYHQKYYQKSSLRYQTYKKASGRADWVENQDDLQLSVDDLVWGDTFIKPSQEQLKKTLSPIQYKVTQEDGTEPSFQNEYHDNKRPGIYIDIVSGEPLFSSIDKYDSGTGRPSFVKPIYSWAVISKIDRKLWMTRTEIRSALANSHLGHVFDDGPVDRGWMRYCMNSAAMAFIPAEDLEKRGYKQFIEMFPDIKQKD